MIIGAHIHRAAIFLSSILHTFQSIPMELRILFGSFRKPVPQLHIPFIIIIEQNNQEVLSGMRINMDQPFLFIWNLQLAFYSIVQRISKNRTDIHRIHKIKKCTINNAGHGNTMLLAIQCLQSKHNIQHIISGFILCLVILQLFFHLIQISIALVHIFLCTQGNDVMLQIVILVVDQFHCLTGLLILCILIVKKILDTFQLITHAKIHTLHMVSIHNGNASQIHQGSYVINLVRVISIKRKIRSYKSKVAHAENSQSDNDIGSQFLASNI